MSDSSQRDGSGPARPTSVHGPMRANGGKLTASAFVLLALYLAGYALARHQAWVVHHVSFEGHWLTRSVTAHAVLQGSASGEVGGSDALVPAWATNPFARQSWLAGLSWSHVVYRPVMEFERWFWYAIDSPGSPYSPSRTDWRAL